jgi:hypothetical protein
LPTFTLGGLVAIRAAKFQSVTTKMGAVTAEVAQKEWQHRTICNPNLNPKRRLSRFSSTFSELDRLKILALSLDLLAIHGVNVALSGL